MATVSPPPKHERHASHLFHRHRSDSFTRSRSLELGQSTTFEGTDAVPQNRKVALQRVIEVHNALEQQHNAEASGNTSRPTSSASSISNDPFTLDFSETPFPDAEVRAFRYFARKWDPSMTPDPVFDEAIAPTRLQFEEAAIKHFFRRIALWNEDEEALEATRQRLTKRWRRKDKQESQLLKMWMKEKEQAGENEKDDLKEATTREGLAQLLWTLLHDPSEPLAPELNEEFKQALRKYYGMTS